jgi:hypothetical protein
MNVFWGYSSSVYFAEAAMARVVASMKRMERKA